MVSSTTTIFVPSYLQEQASNNHPSSLSTGRDNDNDSNSPNVIQPIQTDSVVERKTGFWLSLFVIIFSLIYFVGLIIYAKMNDIYIPSPFDFIFSS